MHSPFQKLSDAEVHHIFRKHSAQEQFANELGDAQHGNAIFASSVRVHAGGGAIVAIDRLLKQLLDLVKEHTLECLQDVASEKKKKKTHMGAHTKSFSPADSGGNSNLSRDVVEAGSLVCVESRRQISA